MSTATLTVNNASKSTQTTTWKLDPSHSEAQFKVKHMMIANVTGEFKQLEGTFVYSPEDPALSYVETILEAGSIHTKDEGRDAHLKSADFFDVENHKQVIFRSKKFEYLKDGGMNVTGDLTIRGVTNEVTLKAQGPSDEMKDPWGNTRVAVSGSTTINRKDFGLTWNAALELGGVLVGEDVKILIEAQYIKEAQ